MPMHFNTHTLTRWNNHMVQACLALGCTLLSACGGGESTSTTTTATADSYAATATSTSTATVGCPVSGSGSQLLTYSQMGGTNVSTSLNYNFSVTCSGNFRTIAGNGVPNHTTSGGDFAAPISAQTIDVSVTSNPDLGVTGTSYLSRSGTAMINPGIAINTVKFDPGTAGTCLSSATSAATGCDASGRGSGTWVMEAMKDPSAPGTWAFDFGTDDSNAHVQPNGQYHYHGIPTQLIPKLNTATSTSMTLVGWAADGYPMYARFGYTTATDSSSALKVVTGSYQLKSATALASGRPSTTYFSLGHFTSDWQYVAASGDLDECNGRYGVTPEFPKGTYHYYITESYPFIQRCVKGNTITAVGRI